MIEARKEDGWEFFFLGANIDAAKEAEKIGIARESAVTYENDCKGIAINYEVVGKAVMKLANSKDGRVELDENWADEIVEYRKSKKGAS